MSFSISEAMPRFYLAREYLSKVKCCDECFCESWCIENGTKNSRVPYKGCEWNIIKYIAEMFRD